MLQSEKTRDDKPRKVFWSSTETPELEGAFENFVHGPDTSRISAEIPVTRVQRANCGVLRGLEWRFGEQHTRDRISWNVVGAALRRDRHSNKQNWRFIGNLRLSLSNSTEFHELGVAPKCFRIRCEASPSIGDS
ncbi:hypothetical protein ALC57_06268 [Trachymyrmex cornetzi]|uniref:Uncharacterized protein n=1 Tax=Trachymyrmex cornetzi TaxID=471704 RepID=A0A195E813_9HYME|nr:hypothetical protein ALC57_06268 [Trachymyrmex cornetzi]